MSAFMSSNKTLNHIVSLFEIVSHGDYIGTSGLTQPISDLGYDDYHADRLFDDLIKLNAFSLEQRYGDDKEETYNYTRTRYTYRLTFDAFGTPAQNIQTYKYLSSFLYQSCEGDAINHPLYTALSNVRDALARYIVRSTTEYDNAEWD